jgi:hypothetical protein
VAQAWARRQAPGVASGGDARAGQRAPGATSRGRSPAAPPWRRTVRAGATSVQEPPRSRVQHIRRRAATGAPRGSDEAQWPHRGRATGLTTAGCGPGRPDLATSWRLPGRGASRPRALRWRL